MGMNLKRHWPRKSNQSHKSQKPKAGNKTEKSSARRRLKTRKTRGHKSLKSEQKDGRLSSGEQSPVQAGCQQGCWRSLGAQHHPSEVKAPFPVLWETLQKRKAESVFCQQTWATEVAPRSVSGSRKRNKLREEIKRNKSAWLIHKKTAEGEEAMKTAGTNRK